MAVQKPKDSIQTIQPIRDKTMSTQSIALSIDNLKKQALVEQSQCRTDITAVIADLRGKIATSDRLYHERMAVEEAHHKNHIAGLTETIEQFRDMLVKVEGPEVPEAEIKNADKAEAA